MVKAVARSSPNEGEYGEGEGKLVEGIIREREVERFLQIVRRLKDQHLFCDIHAHPFEVLFGSLPYCEDRIHKGLYHTREAAFKEPKVSDLPSEVSSTSKWAEDEECRFNLSAIYVRKVYDHTGPEVFGLHMRLSGIGHTLLLPVASSNGPMDQTMRTMMEIFGEDRRFSFAGSVPNTIADNRIREFIKEEIARFKIIAIKCHPNITGINLDSSEGKERLEGILEACAEYQLPLVLHGGRSEILQKPEARDYGLLENFRDIDWALSSAPVVIAHAGGFGCNRLEMEQDVCPTLKRLLSQNPHLMIDISGLGVESLVLILKQVDVDRILFGSDALYEPPWAVMGRLLYAIEKAGMDVEETLVQIGSINPSRFILKRSPLSS